MKPRRVAIIGSEGAMGRWLRRCFDELGHETLGADLTTELRPLDAAARADVVLLSVPIDSFEGVVQHLSPVLKPETLLCDVTSLKALAVDAMLKTSAKDVVGMHPLFGPGVESRRGHRIVLCPARGTEGAAWLSAELKRAGLEVLRSAAAEHDAMMGIVQVLVHVRTQVFGLALKELAGDLEATLPYVSPAYLLELYIAARHFGQSPKLYGPLEMRNPELRRVLRAFTDALAQVATLLERGDQAGFEALFAEVRAFFGDFEQEATLLTSAFIEELAEKRSELHASQAPPAP